jgi:hypothetical protein
MLMRVEQTCNVITRIARVDNSWGTWCHKSLRSVFVIGRGDRAHGGVLVKRIPAVIHFWHQGAEQ